MTQQVTLEDGSVHAFPDDATPDEMTTALAAVSPPQDQNYRLAKMGGSKIVEGLENFAGAPGDIADLYEGFIGSPFSRMMQGQKPQFGVPDPSITGPINSVLPNSQQTIGASNAAGVTNRPDLAPQTEGENLYASTMKGVGSTAPLALFGGLSAIPNLIAQGAGSGFGQQVAKDYLPNWMPGKEAIGSVLGGFGAGGAENLVEKGINAASGATSDLLKSYQNLDIKPRLVGDVSQNPTMQALQGFATKAPFGANPVREASKDTLDEFGNAVNKTADIMGSSQTLQEAGQTLQDHGKIWMKDFKNAQESAANDVAQTIGTNAPVSPSNTRSAIGQLTLSSNGNQALSDALKSPTTQDIINVLAENGNNPLTWEQAAALRTKVGQTLESTHLIGTQEQAQAKLLYGALTKDMENGALLSGSSAGLAKFRASNLLTSQGHDFVDNVLGDVMNATPEQAASGLLASGTKGGTKLQMLRDEMPEAADELGSASIRRMAAGESNASGGNAVSPSRWLSNQDPTRRLAPEANAALFPHPDVQARMQDLDKVAQSMRSTEAFVNHSNSASNLEVASMFAAPEAIAAGAVAGHEVGGVPGALAGGTLAATPFMAGPLAGRLSTSSALARLMATPSVAQKLGKVPTYLNSALVPFSLNGGQ